MVAWVLKMAHWLYSVQAKKDKATFWIYLTSCNFPDYCSRLTLENYSKDNMKLLFFWRFYQGIIHLSSFSQANKTLLLWGWGSKWHGHISKCSKYRWFFLPKKHHSSLFLKVCSNREDRSTMKSVFVLVYK